MKANKGEWAEFYTHIKIISDRKIYKGNSKLEIDNNLFYPVSAVFKQINKLTINKFNLDNLDNFTLSSKLGDKTFFNYDIVKSKVIEIFKNISENTGSFEIPVANLLAKEINLPVKNQIREKSDITLQIENIHNLDKSILGFSIKSKLTANSTLLNASLSTRIVFEIDNLDEKYIEDINKIDTKSKVRDKIQAIVKLGGKMKPSSIKSKQFETNLKYFDSQFEKIISQMLLLAYSNSKKLKDIINLSEFETFLTEIGINKNQCVEKVKDFLLAFALGMEPIKPYTGLDDLVGGIIWVKKDGSLICQHLFERPELKQYLFDNTFFESPSTDRHQYGFIYKNNNQLYFDLCLQIRFT